MHLRLNRVISFLDFYIFIELFVIGLVAIPIIPIPRATAGFHLSLELQTGGFKWSFFGIDLFLIVRVVVGLVFDS